VGDGGGEAGAELLVGGQIASAAPVHEGLPSTVHLVRNLQCGVGEEPGWRLGAFVQPGEGLAGAAARRDDTARLVEDDDDLAALLDERPAAFRLDAQGREPAFGRRSARPKRKLHPRPS
jgi:hypothetical protein